MEKLFILWDLKDGTCPPYDDDGAINTSGCLGRLTLDNAYLSSYAEYPPNGWDQLQRLEIGQCVRGVKFRLSGGCGSYNVYRVR